MIGIPGSRLQGLQPPQLVKVRDLQYFDGPLLSEFKEESGDHYLGHWCDCDEQSNRWLLVRVSQRDIIRLVNQVETLRNVLLGDSPDRLYYFLDISSEVKVVAVSVATLAAIPEDYLPSEDSFLDVKLMPRDEVTEYRYSVLLDGDWSMEALRDMPRKYENAYVLLYAADQARSFSEGLGGYPWRGGFSAVNFYKEMRAKVPPAHRPELQSIHYASPGYLTFRSVRRISLLVAQAIHQYRAGAEFADKNYSAVESYIRDNGLNDLAGSDDYDAEEHDPELRRLGANLLQQLPGVEFTWLLQKTESVFEAVKIAMTHFRRIRELATYEETGLVEFIEPTLPDGPRQG